MSDIIGNAMSITGVLCFVEADWPLIGGAFTTRAIEVLWPKKLYLRLAAQGPHESNVVETHELLAISLPSA